jgi:hypothetical protein
VDKTAENPLVRGEKRRRRRGYVQTCAWIVTGLAGAAARRDCGYVDMLSTLFQREKWRRCGRFRDYPRFPDHYFYNEFSLLKKKRMGVNGRRLRATSAILPRRSRNLKAALLPMERDAHRRTLRRLGTSNRIGAAG